MRRMYGALQIAQRHPRIFAALHRLLVIVSGQPDSMRNPQ